MSQQDRDMAHRDDTPQSPTFGALLKEYRRAAGLSQEQLAARAGLSTDAISALERGTRQAPYRDTVQLLARALGLAPAEQAAWEAGRALSLDEVEKALTE